MLKYGGSTEPIAVEFLSSGLSFDEINDANGLAWALWDWAASRGYADVMTTLLSRGINVNARTGAALRYACRGIEVTSCTRLIISSASPVLRAEGEDPPFIECAKTAANRAYQNPRAITCALSIFELLVAHGESPDTTRQQGLTALHICCRNSGTQPLVEWLLEKGARPNLRDDEGKTPLYHATVPNDGPSITKILLEKGASPKIQDYKSRTPLEHAARHAWSINTIKLLAAASNPTKSEWDHLLYEATPYGFLEILEYFLDQGADPCVEYDEDSALFRAMSRRQQSNEVVHLFFKYGARGDFKTKSGITALHHIATEYENNHTHEWIALLIQYGADIEALHKYRLGSDGDPVLLTPLWEACAVGIHGSESLVIKAFISAGANPYIEIKPGKTVLCTGKTGRKALQSGVAVKAGRKHEERLT